MMLIVNKLIPLKGWDLSNLFQAKGTILMIVISQRPITRLLKASTDRIWVGRVRAGGIIRTMTLYSGHKKLQGHINNGQGQNTPPLCVGKVLLAHVTAGHNRVIGYYILPHKHCYNHSIVDHHLHSDRTHTQRSLIMTASFLVLKNLDVTNLLRSFLLNHFNFTAGRFGLTAGQNISVTIMKNYPRLRDHVWYESDYHRLPRLSFFTQFMFSHWHNFHSTHRSTNPSRYRTPAILCLIFHSTHRSTNPSRYRTPAILCLIFHSTHRSTNPSRIRTPCMLCFIFLLSWASVHNNCSSFFF